MYYFDILSSDSSTVRCLPPAAIISSFLDFFCWHVCRDENEYTRGHLHIIWPQIVKIYLDFNGGRARNTRVVNDLVWSPCCWKTKWRNCQQQTERCLFVNKNGQKLVGNANYLIFLFTNIQYSNGAAWMILFWFWSTFLLKRRQIQTRHQKMKTILWNYF